MSFISSSWIILQCQLFNIIWNKDYYFDWVRYRDIGLDIEIGFDGEFFDVELVFSKDWRDGNIKD